MAMMKQLSPDYCRDLLLQYSPAFEGFPWTGQVYMWEWGRQIGRGWYNGMELQVWHDPVESETQDGAALVAASFADHVACWRWLEERFDMLEVPQLSTSGYPSFTLGEGQASWRLLRSIGTYVVGRTRSPASSSGTSTRKPAPSGPAA